MRASLNCGRSSKTFSHSKFWMENWILPFLRYFSSLLRGTLLGFKYRKAAKNNNLWLSPSYYSCCLLLHPRTPHFSQFLEEESDLHIFLTSPSFMVDVGRLHISKVISAKQPECIFFSSFFLNGKKKLSWNEMDCWRCFFPLRKNS